MRCTPIFLPSYFKCPTCWTFGCILGKPVILNSQHAADLPSSWYTLAVLAPIPGPGCGKRRNALARVPYVPSWLGPDSVWAIVEVGELLVQAKAALEHGEFLKMVEEELPFTDRAARYPMLIGKHPVISNRKHASVLPSSWYTLGVLAQLSESQFLEQLEAGVIHPEMRHMCRI